MENAKVEGVLPPVNRGESDLMGRCLIELKARLNPGGTLPQLAQGEFISYGFAPNNIDKRFTPNNIDIEQGGAVSQGEFISRFAPNENGGTQGHVHARLADMADGLFGLNIQGAISLVGYITLTGKGFREVFYLVVFLYLLGFLAAFGGKLFRSSRMGMIGSLATMLAFLINMSLLVIYKI